MADTTRAYRPNAVPATVEEFWQGVEDARTVARGEFRRTVTALAGTVNSVSERECQALQARFLAELERLHSWRHRAAFELFAGLADERLFVYGAAWLVGHGWAVFDRVAADADALADLRFPQDAHPLGELLAGAVMWRRPGWAEDGNRAFPAWTPAHPPAGQPYAGEAAARADLPRLAARTTRPLTLPPWRPFVPDSVAEMSSDLLVEVWFPLGEHGEDFLEHLETVQYATELPNGEWYDGEEADGHYVIALGRASERDLLDVARTLAELPGAPAGTFALVTSTGSALAGTGRRVALT